MSAVAVVSPEQVLRDEVAHYVRKGYRVIMLAPREAQLVKPKKFSFVWALAWFLLAGIGLVVYLVWYAGKRDRTVYLSVDDQGRLSRR